MSGEGLFIDHVIYGVVDIDAACERLREEHGLGWVPGSEHLGGRSVGRGPRIGTPSRSGPPACRAIRCQRYEAAGHACAPTGFTFVEVGDHEPVLEGWLGPDHGLSVRDAPGTGPGIRACGIATADGEIILR